MIDLDYTLADLAAAQGRVITAAALADPMDGIDLERVRIIDDQYGIISDQRVALIENTRTIARMARTIGQHEATIARLNAALDLALNALDDDCPRYARYVLDGAMYEERRRG